MSRSRMICRWIPCALLATFAVIEAAPSVAGQDRHLRDAVPPDVYFYVYAEKDPQIELVESYYMDVFNAVLDARFDDTVLQILAVGLAEDELTTVTAVRDHVFRLLEGVPWEELGKNEFLFTRALRAEQYDMADVLMWGMTVDDDQRLASQQGLRELLLGLAQLSDKFDVELTVGDETYPSGEFPPTSSLVGGETVMYRAVMKQSVKQEAAAEGDVEWVKRSMPVGFEIAFHGNHVLIGFNPLEMSGHPGLVEDAIGYLDGERSDSLTSSQRFETAFESLQDGYEVFYLDFPNMFAPVKTLVNEHLPGELPQHGQWDREVIMALVGQCESLINPLESVATSTHMLDELNMVIETAFRYEDSEATRSNPLFLATAGGPQDQGLLELVPADCADFSMNAGCDLAPLHGWAVESVRRYVPDGEKALALYEVAQAVVGVDVERELLPLLGSGYVTMTFPARQPTAFRPSDSVTVFKPKDTKSARSLYKRFARVVNASSPFMDDLNIEIDKAERQIPMLGLLGFRVSVEDTQTPFPGMMKIKIGMAGGGVETTFGFVGDMWVSGTSPEAMTYVFETMAGEHANITENDVFTGLARLPEEPVLSCSLRSYEGMTQGIIEGLHLIQKVAGMAHPFIKQEDPQVAEALGIAIDALPKVVDVISTLDFFDKTVAWSAVRDEGLQIYERSVTVHKAPSGR